MKGKLPLRKYFRRLMSLSIHSLFTIKTDNYREKLVIKNYMKNHYYKSKNITQ